MIFKMSNLQSNWEFQMITTTLKNVNRNLKEVVEKKQFLKSIHVLGDKILLLVGQPKKD